MPEAERRSHPWHYEREAADFVSQTCGHWFIPANLANMRRNGDIPYRVREGRAEYREDILIALANKKKAEINMTRAVRKLKRDERKKN